MSMPRAATSVATRKRRFFAFMRPMTRSRSALRQVARQQLGVEALLRQERGDDVVSSRVLQKMIALSGSSARMIPGGRGCARCR